MEKGDVDDIFKDFEHKVTDKEKAPHHPVNKEISHHPVKKEVPHHPKKELNEDQLLKNKYQKAERALKEKYKEEKTALEEKKKEIPRHIQTHTKNSSNLERVAYVAVILVLVAYTVIDLSFYHGEKEAKVESDQTITAAAVKSEDKANETENKTVEKTAEEKEPVKEEKKLSGVVTFTIGNVYTEVDENDDMGKINSIAFTIGNGKDKILTPVVHVYAYDSTLDEIWETKSRGKYEGIAIEPGNRQTGIVDLSPKTFRNLNLKKNIRLTLDDTKDGFITAVNKEVLIE